MLVNGKYGEYKVRWSWQSVYTFSEETGWFAHVSYRRWYGLYKESWRSKCNEGYGHHLPDDMTPKQMENWFKEAVKEYEDYEIAWGREPHRKAW